MSGGHCITKGTEVCCTPGCQTDVRLKGIRCDGCQRLYREAYEEGYLTAVSDCVSTATGFSSTAAFVKYLQRAVIKGR